MKPSPSNRFLAVSSAVALAAISSPVFAQTSWSGATDGSWGTGTNWSAGIPDSADLITYGAGNGVGIAVANPTQTLDAPRAVLGFSVGNDAASPIVINSGTGSNTLTIGTSGILLNSGTGGNFTSNADIIMAGAQSFTTGTARSITAGNVSNGGFLLTVNTAGSTSTTAINGELSGTGGLTKSGPGTLTLSGSANTFGGQVSLTGGTTNITKLATIGANSSLGTGNGASSLVMNGGTLTYTGAGGDTTNRAIDMRAGAAINNNSATGAISFTAANVIQGGTASARTLTFGGSNAGDNTFSSILGDSGTGANISSLQKNGLGKWIVTGTQLYTGSTIINAGTLAVSGSTVLGGATGSTANANNIVFGSNLNSGALHFETVANLGAADQIRYQNTGGIAGQGGALVYTGTTNQTLSKTLNCDSSIGIRLESNSVGGKLTFNGAFNQTNRPLFLGGTGTGENALGTAFTGSGSLTKRDGGTWVLTQANSYTGGTTLSQGTLVATHANALGTSGTVTINDTNTGSNNTALLLGNITMGRAITVANQGSGTTTLGANGSAALPTFSGAITLAKNVTLDGTGNTDRLTFTGGIGGTGNVTIAGGTNRVVLAGTAANTYDGTTTVSTSSILQLGFGSSLATSLVPDASVVTLDSGSFLKLAKGANSETIGGLSGSGTVRGHEGVTSIASAIVIDNSGNHSFGGVLENGGASGSTLSLTKSGVGTQTLSGTSTYTGATLVSAGTLLVNGSLGDTAVTVGANGTIGGTGSLGGSLGFDALSFLKVVDVNDPLSVTGTITFGSGFGIANLSDINWDLLDLNTPYTVLNSSQDFSLAGLNNFGLANAVPVGALGRQAYFQNGSLAVVVIPEPNAASLIGALGAILLLRRRR